MSERNSHPPPVLRLALPDEEMPPSSLSKVSEIGIIDSRRLHQNSLRYTYHPAAVPSLVGELLKGETEMTAVLIEIIGVIAFLTNVWANILIARKSETGWVIRLVSNVFWLAFGIFAFSIANILNSITFMVINIYGLMRWRRERLRAQHDSGWVGPFCTRCQARLLFSARKRGNGLCGPCTRGGTVHRPSVMTTPATCTDHHRTECESCYEITSQCQCHIGTNKLVTRHGLCHDCRSQLNNLAAEIKINDPRTKSIK